MSVSEQIFGLRETNPRALVGGKAYALGEMIRAGFHVPDGFVLSASAYLHMTPSLQNLLLRQFDTLDAPFVAVRSSAIGEDSSDDAWAGQLETYLNRNRDNLIQDVENCWKSAFSNRAQSYAQQRGIRSTKMAVIVQEMIQSELSGVAFSVHPVTHDETQVVIEAGFGLGEAIVSGQITPDTYVADKKSGQIVEKYLSHQKKKLVRGSNGETAWEETGSLGNTQKLTNQQIGKLCQLTAKLEAFFGYPVDIEWAIYKAKIYVLQTRPITTIGPK